MTRVERFDVQGSRLKSPKECIQRGLSHPYGPQGCYAQWVKEANLQGNVKVNSKPVVLRGFIRQ